MEARGNLELESQIAVSCLVWVLRPAPGSSGSAPGEPSSPVSSLLLNAFYNNVEPITQVTRINTFSLFTLITT